MSTTDTTPLTPASAPAEPNTPGTPGTPNAPYPSTPRTTPAGIRTLGLTIGLATILIGLLCLFILPALSSGPHHLALGVVGSETDTESTIELLDTTHPEAFTITPLRTAEELDAALTDRSLVGGIEITSDAVIAHVASAGSTAISGTISGAATALSHAHDLPVTVVDVVPLPATDPTGVGIGGLAFPLVFGGIVPVVAFRAVLAGRRGWILTGLLSFSAVGGLTVAAMLQFAFGSIEHSFWPVTGAVALGIAALALPLAGLQEAFGSKGFTLAAMLMMFVGNPFAGIATGAAWLPAGVAAIGQLLPPGAAGTLVRAVAYFEGAGGATAALTLCAWALGGLALWLAAPALQARRQRLAIAAQPSSSAAPQSPGEPG